jgi:glutamyl-tRNA synthetase/glutamyl-Q tRNA(Asp) synthetase
MRTRFAPAPTGFLHLGHVANALYVWGIGARFGAEVLLRVEDHDRQRSRRDYESALLDDLDWLGFVPDHFPTDVFRGGACESRQSDRTAIYMQRARALIDRGLVYGCTCSRQQVMAASGSDARVYPGTCRDRGIAPAEGVTWRVRLAAGRESFDDLLTGPHTQEPSIDTGDVVVRDRRGNWTYQFCVVVDDFLQDVDLVVRGEDLLPSTGLQIALAGLLGRSTPPGFAHHPLIMKRSGQKLSKSDGDTGIRELRAAGWRAEDVIGAAAYQVGLTEHARPVAARGAAQLFSAAD